MTARIRNFLNDRACHHGASEPCLVVDLEVVRNNYLAFATALPETRVFHAVNANPAPEVFLLLASLGNSAVASNGFAPLKAFLI